eukprot:1424966-Rhodomonas_salina.5
MASAQASSVGGTSTRVGEYRASHRPKGDATWIFLGTVLRKPPHSRSPARTIRYLSTAQRPARAWPIRYLRTGHHVARE